MFWPFGKKAAEAKRKEDEQRRKVAQSQVALLEAASTTADTAHMVTAQLKRHLEDSIMQFESTVRILSDGLIVCDSNGIIKAFNPAAESIFLCPSTDAVHHKINDLFLVEDKVIPDFKNLRFAFEDDSIEVLGKRRNGDTFPLDITTTKLERSDGSTVVLILIRDMTAMVAANLETEIIAQRYRSLFDISFDGILIVQQGTVVAANPASAILFGKDTDSLLKMQVDDLIEISKDNPNTNTIEAEAQHQDGTKLHLLISSADITWNDEIASLFTVKNMSNMTQFETAIRNRRDVSQDMIVCFDADFRITFANAAYCKYYEKQRHEIIGKDIRDLMSESDREALILRLRGLTMDAPTRRLQLYAPDATGALRLQDWVDHISYDDDGNIFEYQCTGKDITDILSSMRS